MAHRVLANGTSCMDMDAIWPTPERAKLHGVLTWRDAVGRQHVERMAEERRKAKGRASKNTSRSNAKSKSSLLPALLESGDSECRACPSW